jgi:hypothetical protein
VPHIGSSIVLPVRAPARFARRELPGGFGRQPPQRADRSPVVVACVVGERRQQDVVGVLQVDFEPAVDQFLAENSFGALGVDPGTRPHVPRADGNGPLAVDACGRQQGPRGVDGRRRRPDEAGDPPGVGQAVDPLGPAGSRQSGRQRTHRTRRRRGLASGKSVVVAGELQEIHTPGNGIAGNQRVGCGVTCQWLSPTFISLKYDFKGES